MTMSQVTIMFVTPFGFMPMGFHQFSDGEFDPGSGRTLAACLRNASRAEEQSSAANGRVTRKQPARKTGITFRKGR